MTDLQNTPPGTTPITQKQLEGLKPATVVTQTDLNIAERDNILKAESWARRRRQEVLDLGFARELHKRMFQDVWRWAGQYRTLQTNIGVEPYRVETELRARLDEAQYQVDNETYSPREIAVRLHHQLVLVHPFPNGNGRWSRLMADLLLLRLTGEEMTWGRQNLIQAGEARETYLNCLREADQYNIQPLLDFASS